MKIEIGESLFYSWLRHVKECHVVQTNWKPSSQWQLQNEAALEHLMQNTNAYFGDLNVYKSNSLSQLLQQAEIDVVGINLQDAIPKVYAIDVAFHENGLNYGGTDETLGRVVKKSIRTAMCLFGYMNIRDGEITFASPKIHNVVLSGLTPLIADVNSLFRENGLNFEVRLITNEDFRDLVLNPILIASEGISDTSELFLRSYQLTRMFPDASRAERKIRQTRQVQPNEATIEIADISDRTLDELKIGKIAQTVLRRILESGVVSDDEINHLQTKDYSKRVFGIDFPLLVADGTNFETVRYYTKPLMIKGFYYRLCSQWYEVAANNDRPFLLKWIAEHNQDVQIDTTDNSMFEGDELHE